MALAQIFGTPFVDLEPHIDPTPLAGLHEEICLALTHVTLGYTGGSHKSMGIVPPSLANEPYRDYGHVIRAMTRDQFVVFASLSDTPHLYDLDAKERGEFGEERTHPLSVRQMKWLETRFGVYFPWKAYYELVPNARWDEKSTGKGKHFTREAMLHFPRTVAFIRSLPFVEIGSCKLLGLSANDHGTVHRDGDPERERNLAHFVTFCPNGDKRLYLWDEEARSKTYAPSRIYWFNDSDYHGVEADPFFRYSIRVDGVFTPEFLKRVS